jgi:hypothetical protein
VNECHSFLLHSSTTPYSEIDIIENVSLQPENEISMYTNYGPCDMEPVTDAMSGAVRDASCYHNIRRRRRRRRRKRQEGEAAKGCGATAADGTFGDAFNERGGGVWALLVDEGGIKIWDFGPGEVPGDIDEGNPRPEEWEIRPVLNFRAGNCDIRKAFQNMKIVSIPGDSGKDAHANIVAENQHHFLWKMGGRSFLVGLHPMQGEDWVRHL